MPTRPKRKTKRASEQDDAPPGGGMQGSTIPQRPAFDRGISRRASFEEEGVLYTVRVAVRRLLVMIAMLQLCRI